MFGILDKCVFMVVGVLVLRLIRLMCFIRKKNGYQPTGLLVYEAKARGFQSVSDMLTMYKPKKQGEEDDKSKDGSPQKRVASEKVWCF